MQKVPARIHIFGASGAGVTTLGKALSGELGIPVFDADFYYWKRTDPPFRVKNIIPDRYALMLADMAGLDSWIISGSMDSWCEPFLPLMNLIVFVYTPADVRVERLKRREFQRHGARILAGGDMEQSYKEFIEWSAQYDEGVMDGRSLPRHEAWLKTLSIPLLRLDGARPTADLVRDVVAKWKSLS